MAVTSPTRGCENSSVQTLIFPTPTPSITMPTSGETYFILNKKGSTALDLSGMDKKSVLGFGFHGGNNQKVRYTVTPRCLSAILDLILISVEDCQAR